MTNRLVPHANSVSEIEIDKDASYGRHPCDTLMYLIDDYTRVNCGVLATVIHQITGWPIFGIHLYHEERQVKELRDGDAVIFEAKRIPAGWDKYPSHAICQQPDGRYIDAWGGDQTAEQIMAPYKTRQLIKLKITDAQILPAVKPDLFMRTSTPYLYTRCLQHDLKILLPAVYDQYQEQEQQLCLI